MRFFLSIFLLLGVHMSWGMEDDWEASRQEVEQRNTTQPSAALSSCGGFSSNKSCNRTIATISYINQETIEKKVNELVYIRQQQDFHPANQLILQREGEIVEELNDLKYSVQKYNEFKWKKEWEDVLTEKWVPGAPEPSFFSSLPPPFSPASPSEWTTDEKIGMGIGATFIAMASAISGSQLHHTAAFWRKKRVRTLLHEYGKTFVRTPEAERNLLMAASYGWLNPIRYIGSLKAHCFKQAVAAMPLDQELSEDLWPLLYRLYFDKEKIVRKDRRRLKKLYTEGRLQAKLAAAQKEAAQRAARERRRRRKKQAKVN